MFIVLRISLCAMHRAKGMLRRRVERIELQGAVARVDNIVPRACGDEDGVVSVHTSNLAQIVSAIAHIDRGSATLHANKLVDIASVAYPALSKESCENSRSYSLRYRY